MISEIITIRVPWGKFNHDGTWTHNPLLSMSKEEQKRQNEAIGYTCRSTDNAAQKEPNAAGSTEGN